MSDLDDLFDRDPLSLSAQDIDAIIAYERKMRAGGKKAKKAKGPKKDLTDLLAGMMKAKPKPPGAEIKRRV